MYVEQVLDEINFPQGRPGRPAAPFVDDSSSKKDLYLYALDEMHACGRKEFHRDKVEQGKPLKRFHFPAAADRILLFQPRGGLVDRIHINQLDILPIGEQTGSDHKPLAVTFDLYVSPAEKVESPCASEAGGGSSECPRSRSFNEETSSEGGGSSVVDSRAPSSDVEDPAWVTPVGATPGNNIGRNLEDEISGGGAREEGGGGNRFFGKHFGVAPWEEEIRERRRSA